MTKRVKMNPLKRARGKKGLTAVKLAEKANVTRQTISRIERGFKAQAETIGKLAIALDIEFEELAELVEGSDSKQLLEIAA